MEVLLKTIELYVFDILGISIKITEYPSYSQLPFFLQNRFTFFQSEISGLQCLLVMPKVDTEETPANLRKQIDKLQEYWEGKIIYVPKSLSSFNRKRLIEKKIPFIVPRNQIYLPFLGFHLPEYFLKRQKESKCIKPSTQKLIVYYLLNKINQKNIPTSLANELGYSIMTLTRAFDELELCGIGSTLHKGRQRIFQFPEDKRMLWDKAQNFMSNPVKQRVYFDNFDINFLKVKSGLTALSHFTTLSAPKQEIYAVSSATWKSIKQRLHHTQLLAETLGIYELEIWHYDPVLLAKKGIADPFSIYISLRHIEDERVEAALTEMMEQIEW